MKRFIFMLLHGVLLTLPGWLWADDPVDRMEIYARQSLRPFHMTKSACFVMTGVDTGNHAKAAATIADTFEADLAALADGDAARGLAAENNAELRDALYDIGTISAGLTASVRQVAAGDAHPVPVAILLSRNRIVSTRFDTVWEMALKHYTDPEIPQALQNSVRKVRQESVLVQELLRDLCYVVLDVNGNEAAKGLPEKIIQFEASLAMLINGDAQHEILKAPNVMIKVTLGKVMAKWGTLKPYLEAAATGGDVVLRDTQLASVIGDSIVRNLDKVLEYYAKL